MKKMLLLVLCVAVSLSHCASFAHEHDYVHDDDLKDKEEVPHAAFMNDAELQADTYYVIGNLYFKYTSDDPGSNYEPYGSVKVNVDTITHLVWEATADSVDIPLGTGVTRTFAFGVVSVSFMSIDGIIEESDVTNDDVIASFSETINVDDVKVQGGKTYEYTGGDGYAQLNIQVITIPG